jgi:hypothetical protein
MQHEYKVDYQPQRSAHIPGTAPAGTAPVQSFTMSCLTTEQPRTQRVLYLLATICSFSPALY